MGKAELLNWALGISLLSEGGLFGGCADARRWGGGTWTGRRRGAGAPSGGKKLGAIFLCWGILRWIRLNPMQQRIGRGQ